MENAVSGMVIRVQYARVDGAHFFTSPEVKGLCAAHNDLYVAFSAVGRQLGFLLRKITGSDKPFEPTVPFEELEAAISRLGEMPNIPRTEPVVPARWATTN